VVSYLAAACSMGMNGAMLVSSINDFGASAEFSGTDLGYALVLPSYAAVGWYHHMLDEKYQSMPLDKFLDEVTAFAANEYQAALFKGTRLTDAEKDEVVGKISGYTGLKPDFVRDHNLRIATDQFCPELLRDKNLMVGRIDGRYTGPITAGEIGNSAADPSTAALGNAFGGAINDYLSGELNYHTDLVYETLSNEVGAQWSYGLDNQTLSQKQDIYATMSQNRFLKWWVLGGYYDLATPFFAAQWVYDHLFLNPETQGNLTFTLYPSGHMMYMYEPSLAQFRQEAEAWYKAD